MEDGFRANFIQEGMIMVILELFKIKSDLEWHQFLTYGEKEVFKNVCILMTFQMMSLSNLSRKTSFHYLLINLQIQTEVLNILGLWRVLALPVEVKIHVFNQAYPPVDKNLEDGNAELLRLNIFSQLVSLLHYLPDKFGIFEMNSIFQELGQFG